MAPASMQLSSQNSYRPRFESDDYKPRNWAYRPDASSYRQEVASLSIPFHGGSESDEDGVAGVSSLDKGKGKADDAAGEEPPTAELDQDTDEDSEHDIDWEAAEAEDLSWVSVAPPAALTRGLPDDLPEILSEIVKASIEGVQSRAAQAIAERAARAEKAEAEKARAATEEEAARERACIEKSRREEEEGGDWPMANASLETDIRNSKGKGVEIGVPESPVWQSKPLPQRQQGFGAAERRSRRRVFAARLLRHVHVHSNRSQGGGESSAAGAASGVPAAAERDFQWLRRNGLLLGTEPGATAAGLAAGPVQPETLLSSQPTALRVLMRPSKETIRPETIECISCFDVMPARESVKTVCHSYCHACFQRLVTTALENEAQFPPKCCLNEVPAKTVLRHVPRDVAKRYSAKVDEFGVPMDERLYCPHVDCGLYVPKSHMSKAARIARCRNGHETCTRCRQAAHGTGSQREPCPEDRDQQLADALAADAGWRRCTRCAILIEHQEACQHMTCRCGAEFCYVCGAVWRTCACSMDDLHRLKARAAERRVAREERERAAETAAAAAAAAAGRELEELREALRQVEAFEREETRRLEAQRAEQRRRLAALRRRREAAVRREVAARHADLQARLESLTTAQRTAARQTRRGERTARAQADGAALAALQAEHAQKRTAAATAAEQQVRAAEQAWERDYRQRVVLERRAEEAYGAEMLGRAELWAGREDRLDRVAEAVRRFMRHNDARLDAYLRWRDGDLEAVRSRAADERGMRGELLDRARRLAVEAQQTAAEAQRRRQAAERTWIRAVAAERRRRLADVQRLELDVGLDGSTAPADAELLLLIELDRVGGLDGLDSADVECSLVRQEERAGREGGEGGEGGEDDDDEGGEGGHDDDEGDEGDEGGHDDDEGDDDEGDDDDDDDDDDEDEDSFLSLE